MGVGQGLVPCLIPVNRCFNLPLGKPFQIILLTPCSAPLWNGNTHPAYPPKGSGYFDERTEQGMSGKENTLLPMPDPVVPVVQIGIVKKNVDRKLEII